MMKEKQFKLYPVGENDKNKRIDKIIRKIIPDANLSVIYSSLRKGKISVNNRKTKPDYKIQDNDTIWVHKSLYSEVLINKHEDISSSGKELKIIYEDKDLIAVNKDAGVLCHGEKSLNNDVINYLKKDQSYSLSFSPGPINRLDRNTSGLNLFSKSLKGAQTYSTAFQKKTTKKFYLGLVDGRPEGIIVLDTSISRNKAKKTSQADPNGKEAETILYKLYSKENYSLCLFHIKTGRTHQIRLHASEAGHPLCGDRKYNGSTFLKSYFLHSYALFFTDNENLRDILKAELTKKQTEFLSRFFASKEIISSLEKADELINTSYKS